MAGAALTEYTPESIKEITEVLAPQSTNYANDIAEQIGQAQSSMGPNAAAAMGQSQTAGLGNYTYNRLLRPTVDTLRDEILVDGYFAQSGYFFYEKSGGTTTTTNSGWDGTVEKNNGGDTDDFWKSATVTDDKASYGLREIKRPSGLTDEQWYEYAKKWVAEIAGAR